MEERTTVTEAGRACGATEDRPVTLAGLGPTAAAALGERLGEPGWLRDLRAEAWRLAEALPLPDPAQEEWRRTDLSGLDLAALVPAPLPRHGAGIPRVLEDILGLSGDGAGALAEAHGGLLVHRDAGPVRAALDAALAARGVRFTDLATATRDHPDLLREHLHRLIRPEELKFRALGAALRGAGTFLYVPPGVEVTVPLLAAAWLDTPGALHSPHTLVVADRGSVVTLIEVSGSLGVERQTLVTRTTELVVGEGAQVRHVLFQEWGAGVWEVGAVRARLARDATLRSLVVAFGGSLVKTDVECLLAGPGAQSEMLGVYFGADRQHVDFHTLQEHQAPHTLSDLLYKGAVQDRARTVFAGLIRVHYGAQKTNAFQSNRNLILNAGAKADSIPKLEIMANDLRCTHGSATSRLHEEHLFYLMSRGLTRPRAVRMVVDGFFAEVLDRIPLERLRARVHEGIAARLARRQEDAAA
ncbi:MAG: Fe-S cluster assembly protein SufD [Armatimonadota bacterium]|nr:Fe-S cluster assembly protein SufD [Armatimonadota bacterium]MDR7448985.1 Fe-S cluster assembly protein SufD [Armatimonadota bacterium]MDR7458639.1 Fe-S cluster assembly protein SufD [Armatimonadota bacterium]MDR7479548.1 Fe-S cluster assembly protein SufD [Armatimonadota bacterium]MDR7489318.1 Fe-S cluster assembly protein SufD [Armatimonadota bacterium]